MNITYFSYFLTFTSLKTCQKTKSNAKHEPEQGSRIYETVKAPELGKLGLTCFGQIKLYHSNCLPFRDLENTWSQCLQTGLRLTLTFIIKFVTFGHITFFYYSTFPQYI